MTRSVPRSQRLLTPSRATGTSLRNFAVTLNQAPVGFSVTVPYTRVGSTADDGNNNGNCPTGRDFNDTTAGTTADGGSLDLLRRRRSYNEEHHDQCVW